MKNEIAITPEVAKKYRKLRALKQSQAATVAGVHTNTIQKWEREGITESDVKRARYIMQIINSVK